MSNVSYLKEVKKSNSNSDFHLQDLSFDIEKLQDACDEVLNMKGFDTSLGIPHFAGISLNQIPLPKELSPLNYQPDYKQQLQQICTMLDILVH